MTYLAVADMAENVTLGRRLLAAVALERIDNPSLWLNQYRWEIVSPVDWQEAWDDTHGSDDPGADPDVITDDMIRDRVQIIQQRNER